MLQREEIEESPGPWAGDSEGGRSLMFDAPCHPGAGLAAYYVWPRGSVKLRCYVCQHEVAEIRVAAQWAPARPLLQGELATPGGE